MYKPAYQFAYAVQPELLAENLVPRMKMSMNNIDLNAERTLTLKFGHAYLLWHVLSSLASETNFKSAFTDMEQKAVWAFEDQLEGMLAPYALECTEDEFVHIKKNLEEFVADHVDADFT